jgi:hypothetical protein
MRRRLASPGSIRAPADKSRKRKETMRRFIVTYAMKLIGALLYP